MDDSAKNRRSTLRLAAYARHLAVTGLTGSEASTSRAWRASESSGRSFSATSSSRFPFSTSPLAAVDQPEVAVEVGAEPAIAVDLQRLVQVFDCLGPVARVRRFKAENSMGLVDVKRNQGNQSGIRCKLT